MVGSRPGLIATFVELGQPQAGHQVQLVDRQRPFKRVALASVISRGAMHRCQVHPKGRFRGVCGNRRGKMPDSLVDIAGFERVQPEFVEVVRAVFGQGLSAQ